MDKTNLKRHLQNFGNFVGLKKWQIKKKISKQKIKLSRQQERKFASIL